MVQRWIAPPDGKTTIIARPHGISLFYYDLWNECSDIEIRRNGEIRAYDIGSVCTYPRKRFIPKLKHNGFNGNYYNLLPYDFLKAILSDSRAETMLKAGQYPMLHHYIRNSFDIGQYWVSYSQQLHHFGRLNVAGYHRPAPSFRQRHQQSEICISCRPQSRTRQIGRKEAHTKGTEQLAERKQEAVKHEKKYRKLKGCFFGIAFTDGTLDIHVLENVAEFAEEGTAMHHCV